MFMCHWFARPSSHVPAGQINLFEHFLCINQRPEILIIINESFMNLKRYKKRDNTKTILEITTTFKRRKQNLDKILRPDIRMVALRYKY